MHLVQVVDLLQLPPPTELGFVSPAPVCLSASRITQNIADGFGQTLRTNDETKNSSLDLGKIQRSSLHPALTCNHSEDEVLFDTHSSHCLIMKILT